MTRAFIKISSVALAIAILLCAGIGIGIKLQSNYVVLREDVGFQQASTIAVVNQDLGVVYNNEDINFSSLIIDTLDSNYVLTSKSAGETGINNGKYAAVVAFSTSFSQDIASINTTAPQPANFSYQLNPNLSLQDSVETAFSIMKIESEINNRFSFMYISSLFEEVHQAQDATDLILENNDKNMSILTEFTQMDFVKAVEYQETPQSSINESALDFSQYENQNNTFINAFYSKFSKVSDEVNTELTPIKNQLSNAINQTQNIREFAILKKYKDNNFDYQDYLEFLMKDAEIETRKLNQKTGLLIETTKEKIFALLRENHLEKAIFTPIIGFSESLGASMDESALALGSSMVLGLSMYYKQTIEEKVVESIGVSGISAIYNKTGINLISVLKEIGILMEPEYIEHALLENTSLVKEMGKEYVNADEQIEADKRIYIDFVKDNIAPKIEQSIGEIILPVEEEVKQQKLLYQKSVTHINLQEEAAKNTVNKLYQAHLVQIKDAEKIIVGYNIDSLSKENEEVLKQLKNSIDEDASKLKTEVDAFTRESSSKIDNLYLEFGEQKQKISEAYDMAKSDTDTILHENIGHLSKDLTTTKKQTEEYIQEFANKMPNSKIGSIGNSNLYSFMAKPVNMDGNAYLDTVSAAGYYKKEVGMAVNIPIIIIILSVLFIVITGLHIFMEKKKKDSNK